MPKKPHRLPITPGTVEVLGERWTATTYVWAGLRFHLAKLREHSLVANDHHLGVPFCHPDDDRAAWDGTIYRVRPRDEAYRFVKARNGVWVLELRHQAES